MSDNLPATTDSWKTQTYILGGIAGLLIGILTAYFFARVSEEDGNSGPSRIKTIDGLKLAVSVLGIMRQITDLGAGGKK